MLYWVVRSRTHFSQVKQNRACERRIAYTQVKMTDWGERMRNDRDIFLQFQISEFLKSQIQTFFDFKQLKNNNSVSKNNNSVKKIQKIRSKLVEISHFYQKL